MIIGAERVRLYTMMDRLTPLSLRGQSTPAGSGQTNTGKEPNRGKAANRGENEMPQGIVVCGGELP